MTKRREDSSHAPLIEPQSRKAAVGDFREDNDTDEIAGNYEENVNTKKPTRHPARAQMERQNTENRDSSEPVYVGTLLQPGVPIVCFAHGVAHYFRCTVKVPYSAVAGCLWRGQWRPTRGAGKYSR